MRPRTALCGDRKAHGPHPLARVLDDRECQGLDISDAAAGELWRVLREYAGEHALNRRPLPEGITLLAHPSVTYSLMRGLEPDYEDLTAFPAEPAQALPPEIPVMVTTALAEGEWRLVTIAPVMGGVMP
jgi:hypothetical protein